VAEEWRLVEVQVMEVMEVTDMTGSKATLGVSESCKQYGQ
jgi:hypothetical protein